MTDKSIERPGLKPGDIKPKPPDHQPPGQGGGDAVQLAFDIQFLNETRGTIGTANLIASGSNTTTALQQALTQIAADPQLAPWPKDTTGILVHCADTASAGLTDAVQRHR